MERFIKNFALQFDETKTSAFTADTSFKDLDEWDSMVALSVIGMVDEEYSKTINGDDIRNANTIKELLSLVQAK